MTYFHYLVDLYSSLWRDHIKIVLSKRDCGWKKLNKSWSTEYFLYFTFFT